MRSAQCCVAVGGDSPEALRALELFRKVASPAAVQVIEDFMAGRTTEAHPADAPRTLDEFLLAELHRPAKRGEGDRLVPTGPFVTEWQAFARGAMGKDRATVQSRAWTQWEAFGGAKDRAKPLVVDHDEDPFAAVMEHGVVRIDGCLSTETATSLRRRVLAERDACVMEERADGTCACRLVSHALALTVHCAHSTRVLCLSFSTLAQYRALLHIVLYLLYCIASQSIASYCIASYCIECK